MKTHYETLNVPPGAAQSAIRASYLRLAERHHPDKATRQPARGASGNYHDQHYAEGSNAAADCKVCQATATFAAITEAYAHLRDPKRRRAYDATLAVRSKPCPTCNGKGQRKRTGRGFKSITQVCEQCNGTGQASATYTTKKVIQL